MAQTTKNLTIRRDTGTSWFRFWAAASPGRRILGNSSSLSFSVRIPLFLKVVYSKITVNVGVLNTAPSSPGWLGSDERWQLIQRIAASRTLNGSPALKSFLLYITEQALLGHTEDIKEQVIGSHVLGRKPNYDPASDNIVRVRARQLRQKLEQYFETEGIAEHLIISIPKGGYIPV
jgi:hypothetical protein